MMTFKIFYSWQSDLPNRTNRNFIEKALEMAAKSIRGDELVQVEPVIDRDTQGISGAPDISATIFSKIEQCQVFVCDISIINGNEHSRRPTPNPNVLIELGYALKAIGTSKIMLVMNQAYGTSEKLPFDLRTKRILPYNVSDQTEDFASKRKELSKILEKGILGIIHDLERLKMLEISSISPWNQEWIDKQRVRAVNEAKKLGFDSYIEFAFSLSPPRETFDQQILLSATEAAVQDNGWPTGVFIDTEPSTKRKPQAGGIYAEVALENRIWLVEPGDSYDYWALNSNGDFYGFGSLLEDWIRSRRNKFIYFNTRMEHMAEVLLYCSRLYTSLGIDPGTIVYMTITYQGIKDRMLSETGGQFLIHRELYCSDNEVKVSLHEKLSDITPNIVPLVKKCLEPLFSQFDFYHFNNEIYEGIVAKFKQKAGY